MLIIKRGSCGRLSLSKHERVEAGFDR